MQCRAAPWGPCPRGRDALQMLTEQISFDELNDLVVRMRREAGQLLGAYVEAGVDYSEVCPAEPRLPVPLQL